MSDLFGPDSSVVRASALGVVGCSSRSFAPWPHHIPKEIKMELEAPLLTLATKGISARKIHKAAKDICYVSVKAL